MPHHVYSHHALNRPKQTVESVLKAAEQAKLNTQMMETRGKELAEEVKTLRDDFEKKDKEAKEAQVDSHAAQDKAASTKQQLTRMLGRLENTRHEAVHEASKEATEGVANSKQDLKELKIQAKEEARKAAAAEGASATLAISASKAASRSLAEGADTMKKSEVEKSIKQMFAESLDNDDDETDDEDLVQTGDVSSNQTNATAAAQANN